VKAGERHHLCLHCNHERRYSPLPPLPPSPPPSPLFDRPTDSHAPLSPLQRAAIIVLAKDGQSRSDIAAKVGVSAPTVRHWTEADDVKDAPRSGRPRVTDEALDTAIAAASWLDPFASPRQLQARLELQDVSDDTIARRLDEAGLPARIARREFKLTDGHKRQRLAFAEGYSRWTEDEWCNVLFADEKLFWGEGHCGKIFVRRPDGSAGDDDFSALKKPHPVSAPAWACFSGHGPGYMRIYEGSVNSAAMAAILRACLVPSYKDRMGEYRGRRWLLHDNDKRHYAPAPQKVIHDGGIIQLDFPPYSPDLNPIENLWAEVQNRMQGKPAATKAQLEELLKATWAATSPEYCNKLARSMPARIAQCIKRAGAYTDY
jgi:transposase